MPDIDVAKLRSAMDASLKTMASFRKNVLDVKKKYAGTHYGGDSWGYSQPVPTLSMFVDVLSRFLISGEPRVLVTTEPDALKPDAVDLELHLNQRARQMRVKDEISLATEEAMLGVGVVKTGAEPGVMREPFNLVPDILYPYARQIDFTDMVWDMTVKRRRDMGFIGHRFDLPVDVAESIFRKEGMEFAEPEDYGVDEQGDGQASDMTTGGNTPVDPFIRRIEGWELFLPYHKKTVWLPKSGDALLLDEDWAGPLHESDRVVGPYHFLVFKEMSDNVVPVAPICDMIDLDELQNLIYSIIRQSAAEYRKNVIFPKMSEDDAKKMMEGQPFAFIGTTSPLADQLKEVEVGGVPPQLMAAGMHIKQLLNWVGSNMDLLGGLGQQADTLGQERLLAGTSSKKVEKWQAAEIDFVRGIYYDLAFYEVNDPLAGGTVWREFGAANIRWPKRVTPFNMRQQWSELNFSIDPYSMNERSPQARAAMLEETVTRLLAPFGQMMMAQGVMIDIEALVAALRRYRNLPELSDIIKFMGVSESMLQGAHGERPPGPAVTSREHVRRNVGPSNEPTDQSILQMANAGGGQMAGMGVG